jgi:hypothetical protein
MTISSQPKVRTPDNRYLVVMGKLGARLWRTSNPNLAEADRHSWVAKLMAARRAVRDSRGDLEATQAARQSVDEAKRALGERGPVWWTDGAPDFNRKLIKNTPYAEWWAARSL